jgi:hypothetical protein
LFDRLPREVEGSPGALWRWLEGRRAEGRVSADDLRFGLHDVNQGQAYNLSDPQLYENYLTTSDELLNGPGERSPLRIRPGPEGWPDYGNDPVYHGHDDLRSPGDNYREVVLRSPELLSVGPGHFGGISGGRRLQTASGITTQPDDILGWLRLQDYHPLWDAPRDANVGTRIGRMNQPYTWIDELQSDRFGDLRAVQRQLRSMRAPADPDPHFREIRQDWQDSLGLSRDHEEARRQLAARVDRATQNMSPWTNTWDSLLFRRALQEAYLRPDTQGLAWTSGMTQANRYAGDVGGYAPMYDQRLPRLARSEARRLQLPETDVGTASVPQQRFNLYDADDALIQSYNDQSSATEGLRRWSEENGTPTHELRLQPTQVQVPFHYFNFNDDTRRALDRYGLPYFSGGGPV